MRSVLLAGCLLLGSLVACGQGVDSRYLREIERLVDSIERRQQVKTAVDQYEQELFRRETHLHYDMFLPLARGLFTTATNHTFIENDALLPEKDSPLADYVPAVAPLAATYALRLVGLEGRSSDRRLFTATGLSLALSIALTQGVKGVVSERRPDGTNHRSLPSQHTAIAYMGATILHREYGHLSPWISVGGYGAATLTEYLRLHHNDHYINDILIGSGIGIASANLGYFLTDRLFGEGDIHRPRLLLSDVQRGQRFWARPTSFALSTGTEFGGKTIEADEVEVLMEGFDGQVLLRTSTTYAVGLEYSYAFDAHWSAEGLIRLSTAQVKPSVSGTSTWHTADFTGDDLSQWHFDVAAKYSLRLSPSIRMNVRLLVGDRLSEGLTLRHSDGTLFAHLPRCNAFEFGSGIGCDLLDKERYATGFSFDVLRAVGTDVLPCRYTFTTYWRIIL